MIELRNWKARRSGGRITIYHDAGKVAHVDTIEPGRTNDAINDAINGAGHVCPAATDKDGKQYRLS